MYAFEKCAYAANSFGCRKIQARGIKLPQIRAGRKSRFLPAVYDQCAGLPSYGLEGRDKLLEVLQHRRANLVARWMMESELDGAVLQLPRKRLRFLVKMKLGIGHVGFLRYIESMASLKCVAMASRRSFPFAVSSPFSRVIGCGSM